MSLDDLEKSMVEMEALMASPDGRTRGRHGSENERRRIKSNQYVQAIQLRLNNERSRNRALLALLTLLLVGLFCFLKIDRSAARTFFHSLQTSSKEGKEHNPASIVPSTIDEVEEVVTEPLPEDVEEATIYVSEAECNDKWGCWKFYDGDKESRPKFNYYSKFPNRDVKADKFPPNAWQADAVYVNHFLDEAEKLVHRAQEAIFEEYGRGEPRTAEQSIEAHQMFHISMINITSEGPPAASGSQGGWTTQRSFASLIRRLLHAMMTKDTFTVVMAGHSAAAGHDNHFNQSYMMQFHHVMEPVFEHLGMKLITRNMGQGGLGTIQNALGAQSIYGDEIDMMLWDSHMTEPGGWEFDLFCRQALLGSNRAPFLMGLGAEFAVLKVLHEEAGADVGGLGSGISGVFVTTDEKQAETLPWAVRFLNCAKERLDLCDSNKRRIQCWVDRQDVIPPTKQQQGMRTSGGASWHPGFRSHQLTGRVLAFFVLQALDEALHQWSDITITQGHPLPGEYWHISDYYDRIQQGVKTMPPSFCEDASEGRYPQRICRTSLKAKTEYTPRANPDFTSIRSILKSAPDGYIPYLDAPLYEGDDVPNPALALPEGALDVRSILSRRFQRGRLLRFREYSEKNVQLPPLEGAPHHVSTIPYSQSVRRAIDAFTPGRGWTLQGAPGFCDGTTKSRCGRMNSSDCLLWGHNDVRGGINGDALSGWLVMTLEGVKEGIIMMNIDFWHGKVSRTEGWTEVNDGKRSLHQYRTPDGYVSHRGLGGYVPPATNIVVEFALNGKTTIWDNAELVKQTKVVQRVVQWIVLLNDEGMPKSGRVENIELAFRLNGCGRECMLSINHVYWA